MDITLTELWLFAWAVVATCYALKRDTDANNHMHMLKLILDNKKARVEILERFDKFKEKINASEI